MKNINRFSFVLRILMNALVIIITSLAFGLIENNFIEQLKDNIIFQLILLPTFLVILVFSIIQFRKQKDSKALGDLITVGLCLPIILLSVINTSEVNNREKALSERVVRIHTVEYSIPDSIDPKIEYYQAFLLSSNNILLSTDVLYSNKQVFYGNRKLWPCDNNFVQGPYCIAYFEDPIQIPEIDFFIIPQNLHIEGLIKAYQRPDNDSVSNHEGTIHGSISTNSALLPTDISINDITLSLNQNIIPVSINGHLLGFLQNNSTNIDGVRLHSSIFDGLASLTMTNDTIESPIIGYRDTSMYSIQEWPNTITTFILTPHMLSVVEDGNGFERFYMGSRISMLERDRFDVQRLYEYVEVIYLNKYSSIPIKGEAFSDALEHQCAQYSDAPQTNEDGKKLHSFGNWIGGFERSLVLLENVDTNIFRRELANISKTTIICDEGECEVNYYQYVISDRNAIYR